jgi:hypothetical protein
LIIESGLRGLRKGEAEETRRVERWKPKRRSAQGGKGKVIICEMQMIIKKI